MTVATRISSPSWTCDRCEMTIRYLPGHEPSGPPTGWGVDDDGTHCLACRRDLAAQEAFDCADADLTREDRAKLRVTGRLDFEIKRDPDRTNGEIAKALRCSVPAVLKARARLEASAVAGSS
jgi:hypothetical protein